MRRSSRSCGSCTPPSLWHRTGIPSLPSLASTLSCRAGTCSRSRSSSSRNRSRNSRSNSDRGKELAQTRHEAVFRHTRTLNGVDGVPSMLLKEIDLRCSGGRRRRRSPDNRIHLADGPTESIHTKMLSTSLMTLPSLATCLSTHRHLGFGFLQFLFTASRNRTSLLFTKCRMWMECIFVVHGGWTLPRHSLRRGE
jgi:hypothetical protein